MSNATQSPANRGHSNNDDKPGNASEGRFSNQAILNASLAVGVVMMVAKTIAFVMTDSAAILSDALESIVHIVVVGFSVFALSRSARPPSELHPYGEGMLTYLSVLIEAVLIAAAGLATYVIAIQKLIYSAPLQNLDIGLALTIGAAIVNLFLGLFLMRRGRISDELVLVSNGRHLLSDTITSVGILLALILVQITGYSLFDPICAFISGTIILFSSRELFSKGFNGLVGKRDPVVYATVEGIIRSFINDDLLTFHALRHRRVGSLHQVDFHLLFRDALSLHDAHEQTTSIERKIAKNLGKCLINIHIEPYSIAQDPDHDNEGYHS